MNLDLSCYKTILFDCDGVILNSNKVKTKAFLDLAQPWGADAQDLLVQYHVNNGGISRHKKVKYLLETILPSLSIDISPSIYDSLYESLVQKYADLVYNGLLSCEVSPALHDLRQQTSHARWSVVSGGAQIELNKLFLARGISRFFDAGIFGSPDDKKLILSREFSNQNFVSPALFIGDSRYDYVSASSVNVDFLFLTDWTEFHGWQSFVEEYQIQFCSDLTSLVN